MRSVEKVTVSMPAELLARIEARRAAGALSRSEVMTDLLWRGWRQVETEDREARYRASFEARPDTADERAWAEASGELLFAEDAGWVASAPRKTRGAR